MSELQPMPNCISPKPPSPIYISVMEEEKSTVSTVNIPVNQVNAPKILAEMLGTYIIIFTGCGAILVNTNHPISIVGRAIAWGLAVMIMIYTLGHVSGAHFNPSVTIAFAVSRQFKWKHVPAYVASQITGSVLALLTLKLLFGQDPKIDKTLTQFSYPTTDLIAFAWELTISFFLMFVACGVATDHRAINELSGLVVGATVLLNYLIAGDITGASMNPARSIGPAIVSGQFNSLWIYIISPTLGTIAGAMLYGVLQSPVTADKSDGVKIV